MATDLAGNVTFMNNIAQKLTGWNLEDALQSPVKEVFKIINEESRREVESPVIRVLKEGRIVGLANHTILLRKDGSEVPIDDSGAPIKDKEGKITGVVLVFRDITERKKTDEALRESEKRLNRSQEIAHLGSWELDLVKDKITWSDEVYRIFGLKPQEFAATYEAFLKAVHPDDRKAVDEAYCSSLREGRDSYEIEHRIIRRSDGEVRIVYEKCEHIQDASGKIIRSVGMVHDITERKKTEQELWKAKNDWERTFNTVPDLIAILDKKHRIIRANRAMAQQLGVTPQQTVGLTCYTCVHGTNYPPEFCPYTKTLEDGKEHVAEVHEPHLGGDFIVSTTPLKDEKGHMIGSVHVARNITERKKAEETLRQLNRHLRAVSNSNQASIRATDEVAYTKEVCNIIVNDCGYALVWVGFVEHDKAKSVRPVAYSGFDKSYIDKMKITWADNSTRGLGPTGTAIRTGKPYICRNIQEDPNFRPWRKQATAIGYKAVVSLPLKTFEGETFGVLNIYSKEIDTFLDEEIKLLTELANDFAYGTLLIQLRKEKEEANKLLRKQAELIDLSPDAIIVRQLNGKITFWSKGAEKMYGWTKEETIGKNIHLILKTAASQPFKKIIAELKETNHWSGEVRHTTKNGRRITVQSYWHAKVDKNGEVTEMLESNVDITDRKQMQTILQEHTTHLEELVQERTQQLKDAERLTAIGETAGMVGHDLRNPLQTVTGETFLAKNELKDLPDSPVKRNLEESINIIAEQIDYMDKIVSDLQDFVRPITPNKKPINLANLLNATIAEVKIPDNIEVNTKIDNSLPKVPADAQLLKRVFINLVTNAVQAMPEGGQLMVKTQKPKTPHGQKRILIQVKDTGKGIPKEVEQKIFRPLFTTKSKGQGFGLAVCRRVIDAHGGTITFQSKKGKGTQFTVELPV
jgi:PAS domain S-box-containing protein